MWQRLTQSVFALVVPLVCAVGASAWWFPVTTHRVDFAAGQRLFNQHCSGCHSLSPGASGMGPSLADIGQLAATRVSGQSASDYLFNSIVDPDAFIAGDGTSKMPGGFDAVFSSDQLRELVGFLASQGARPDYREILRLNKPAVSSVATANKPLDLARIEAGRELFYGRYQCGQCHSTGGSVGGQLLTAPSLAGVGLRGRQPLYQAIRNPSEQILTPYRQYQCLTMDGEVFVGRLLHKSDDAVRLLIRNADGSVGTVDLSVDDLEGDDLEDALRESAVSPMPQWSESQMPADDLELLVDFLLTLR